MFRSFIGWTVLGLGGLFAFYFLFDSTQRSNSDKAKDAGRHVLDTVVDEGVASMVKVRLGTAFDLETARFLHVYHNDGKVLVYGLIPPNVTAEAVRAEALKVPGVKEVQVLVQAKPDFIQPFTPQRQP